MRGERTAAALCWGWEPEGGSGALGIRPMERPRGAFMGVGFSATGTKPECTQLHTTLVVGVHELAFGWCPCFWFGPMPPAHTKNDLFLSG